MLNAPRHTDSIQAQALREELAIEPHVVLFVCQPCWQVDLHTGKSA